MKGGASRWLINGYSKAKRMITDIEQVRIEKKLYTLPCRSYRLITMQCGGVPVESVSVERLDH